MRIERVMSATCTCRYPEPDKRPPSLSLLSRLETQMLMLSHARYCGWAFYPETSVQAPTGQKPRYLGRKSWGRRKSSCPWFV
ncbi:hypothetical protein VTN02DRAFT_3258 [Thermoascus thermophilus]